MNAETLISQVGYAIDMFKIDHPVICVSKTVSLLPFLQVRPLYG